MKVLKYAGITVVAFFGMILVAGVIGSMSERTMAEHARSDAPNYFADPVTQSQIVNYITREATPGFLEMGPHPDFRVVRQFRVNVNGHPNPVLAFDFADGSSLGVAEEPCVHVRQTCVADYLVLTTPSE